MDPFVATIIKQAAAITAAGLAVGLLIALGYGFYQYSKLQHAMTLNMAPPQLP